MGLKNLFELERIELRRVNYKGLLAEGTTKFIRIRERFELRDVELEKVNCNQKINGTCWMIKTMF